jgi:phosphoenolpyruvate carboxylase
MNHSRFSSCPTSFTVRVLVKRCAAGCVTMEDETAGDWLVVTPRKGQKSSPKAVQQRKSLKRTDIQRTASSNQINTRRKTSTSTDKLDEVLRPVTRSVKSKQDVKSGVTKGSAERDQRQPASGVRDESVDVSAEPEPLSDMIEGVSSKIKLLSIEEGVERLDVNDDKRKEVSFSATVGHNSAAPKPVLSAQAFCELCRNFSTTASDVDRKQYFQTR